MGTPPFEGEVLSVEIEGLRIVEPHNPAGNVTLPYEKDVLQTRFSCLPTRDTTGQAGDQEEIHT